LLPGVLLPGPPPGVLLLLPLLLCMLPGSRLVLLLSDWLTRCEAAVRLSVLLACRRSIK
jgi:hypothetical protein